MSIKHTKNNYVFLSAVIVVLRRCHLSRHQHEAELNNALCIAVTLYICNTGLHHTTYSLI